MKSHGGARGLNNSSDYLCWPTGITTLPDEYSYIKGWHGDSIAYSDTILTNDYGTVFNFFIGLFNPQGEVEWIHTIDEERIGFDYNQIDTDKKGNVYMGAQLRGCNHFKCYCDEYRCEPTGSYDLFVAIYSRKGALRWVKTTIRGTGYSWLSSVSAADTNEVYMGGYFTDYISIGGEYYSDNRNAFLARIGQDLNQAPPDIALTNYAVAENLPAGTEVGIFTTPDPNPDDLHTYQLVAGDGTNDADNDQFSIHQDTLVTAQIFDYEVQSEMKIYIQATDAGGYTFEKGLTIEISDISEASGMEKNSEIPFRCFPNPVNDLLVVQWDKSQIQATVQLEITDLNGQILIQKNLADSIRHEIEMKDLPPGIYFIKSPGIKYPEF